MAKQKKSTSCLGLFTKGFVLTILVLANLSLATVMIAVKFFGADYATWTDFSHYTSYPWMMILGTLSAALVVGFLMGLVGAAVSVAFGGNSKGKGAASRPKARPKPQSNRKTTI